MSAKQSLIILFMCFLLVPNHLLAEVKVLPGESYSTDNTGNQGWSIPENNSILILPPIVTNKWVKELPRQENLSNVPHIMAAELRKVLAVNVLLSEPVTYPEKFKSKTQQIQWIAEQGKKNNARTVLFVDFNIASNQAPNLVRYFSMPISVNQPQSSFVSAISKLKVLFVDAEFGIAVEEIEGEGMTIGLNVSDQLTANDMTSLRTMLSEELDRMTQRASSDLAFECRVKRLTILRPLIHIQSIEKKSVTLNIGDAMGIEKNSTFAAYQNEGGQFLPVASLTVAEVGNQQVVCKIKSINKREINVNSMVVPYNAKIAGNIREPQKR